MKSESQRQKHKRLSTQILDVHVLHVFLEQEKAQVEANMAFESNKLKKMKTNQFQKKTQKPVTMWFKPDPRKIVDKILEDIFEKAWKEQIEPNPVPIQNHDQHIQEIIPPKDLTHSSKKVVVKASYSTVLKNTVKKYMLEHSLLNTFLFFNRKIPKSTLWDWKNHGKEAARTKQGRKTLLILLEEELFNWFLWKRSRQILISTNVLAKKALKICKNFLMDPEITLNQQEKDAYTEFQASNGWVEKFKGRYKIKSRAITTVCTKTIEEMRPVITSYFNELNQSLNDFKPQFIYNMNEVPIFMETCRGRTLELKSKKIVGKLSFGKAKERITLIITCCSNGQLLPPFLIFKVQKPKNCSQKDFPKNEVPQFDSKTKAFIEKNNIAVFQNYTAWNNNRIMEKYFVPFYAKYTHPNSILIFDNHSSHVSNSTTKALKERNITHINLAPNATPLLQPIDIQIGADIKSKIKSYSEEWIIENEKEIITYDIKKKKHVVKAPSKSLIIEWVAKAYQEINLKMISRSKS